MNKSLYIAAFTLLVLPVMFGGGGNGAFTNDYGNHYVNEHNPNVRFDWDNHRMAVPGVGGSHANENSAIIEWGDGSLVDPHGTL